MDALKSLYTGTQACVTTGVLQGDTAAPYLFITVLDYALRLAFRNRLSLEILP